MSSSGSSSSTDLSGELSSLNIGSGNEKETINYVAICAACGKEGDGDNMNTCNKCDLVQYCNAACKKKHKSKHKKKCERRVAELYDEKLFREPPPREDCPICFLPLPLDLSQVTFHSCCGKDICNGCIVAMLESKGADELCPFCRTPPANSDEDCIKRNKLLMEKGNGDAYYQLAGYYAYGSTGMPQNRAKANGLYLKAGELGCAMAYLNLGNSHFHGNGVEIDKKKAKYYFELAAMGGKVNARYCLGYMETQTGNHHRAIKHFLISARAGDKDSLDAVKSGFRSGIVTKGEYEWSLRAYHNRQLAMKSDARDKAAAVVYLWDQGNIA